MAMQIYGNYDHSGTGYAERVKEKQAAGKAENAKEAGKAAVSPFRWRSEDSAGQNRKPTSKESGMPVTAAATLRLLGRRGETEYTQLFDCRVRIIQGCLGSPYFITTIHWKRSFTKLALPIRSTDGQGMG